ncbi:uncharacterized protein LOC116319333 [Oreochromis aureus]|uniref:uncharacterized protein LOC116319333 n=1 Tax=Oreochromis aureus TaxID=47969 RepID=UPI001954E3CC|nr:uncharacterized protein LOC116319333 [Oreochromis aureus]XP_039466451.1 uncharacterized protein LOC116319333 [Oreochromis aureus]
MDWFHSVSLWIFILSLDFVKGSFVVDVTQSSYQAEENHDITLEWTFTTKPDTTISALRILCSLNNDLTLYYLLDGVEFSEVQDEEFSGRVQSDKDALREGRIRLQLSRLRTDDSGLYLCEVDTGYGRGYNSCRVTVSESKSEKKEKSRQPGRIRPDLDKESKVKVWGIIILAVYMCGLLMLCGYVLLLKCLNQIETSSHKSREFTMTNVSAGETPHSVSGLTRTAGNCRARL